MAHDILSKQDTLRFARLVAASMMQDGNKVVGAFAAANTEDQSDIVTAYAQAEVKKFDRFVTAYNSRPEVRELIQKAIIDEQV